MAGEAVAWLQIKVVGDSAYGTHGGRIEVCGNEQFNLGRDPELCRYSWADDLTISRKHLRIHCILYEQNPIAKIAPFVYVTDFSSNGTCLKKSNSEYTASQDAGILMGPKSTFLLEDGDEIRISETVTLIYCSNTPVELVKLTDIQEREKLTFASRYLLTGRLLGEGGNGKVLVGINQETQRQLACKTVRLDNMYDTLVLSNLRLPTGKRAKHQKSVKQQLPTRVTNCFREFDILKDLSHPNIITIEKVFRSNNTIYIFEELVTGGDLFSFIEYKEGRIDSLQAATIIYQILKGIKYLHDQDIVHRDLKPDNILMSSLEDSARVVITDFGSARFLPGKSSQNPAKANKYQRMFSLVGTLEYMAPEINRRNRAIPAEDGYSRSVDMWSIGTIAATLLTGDTIFIDRRHPEYDTNPKAVILGLAALCDLSHLDDPHHPLWSNVGDQPKDFVKNLLILKEKERMTASEALTHDWFSSYPENLEDMYANSITDWGPCETSHDLVEMIPKSMANSVAAGLIGGSRVSAMTSRYFAVRQPTNTLRKHSSQRWRANTPLPSIMQDHEAAQFASQLQAPSYDNSDPSNQHQQRHSLSATSATGTGMYRSREDADDDTDGSEASLNGFTNNYSQQEHFEYLPPPPEHEYVLVGETPVEVYHQRQWAEDQGHDSILVYETQPEFLRQLTNSSGDDDDLTTYDMWAYDDAPSVRSATHVAGKRRKLSHHT
ncbi:meiosis-specific serine/threonine-protein kinase mek1 [Alternaria rosae]|uniref:meiosis-specific serine/threonine-protein kinase mek1 n=1 Tax=Alternaria rosae TaxID=1187941 RepID=UPI001E8DE970|nr:meiosis-specific serine/threonine-protein kinase mek1 [Alternaria rosae]KAH6848484.1 meiosis-specific serine/threonine-protein kinase mek1 [Alternaria rosae]